MTLKERLEPLRWGWVVNRWRRLVRRYFHTAYDRRLALALIRCESVGDPNAISKKEWTGTPPPGYDGSAGTRASGLTQQVPAYFATRLRAARAWYLAQGIVLPATDSIFDPEINIAVAAWLVYDNWDPAGAPHWHHWSAAHLGKEGCLEWGIKQLGSK